MAFQTPTVTGLFSRRARRPPLAAPARRATCATALHYPLAVGAAAVGCDSGLLGTWRLVAVRRLAAALPPHQPILASASARRVKSDSIEWEEDEYDYDGGFQDVVAPQFAMTEDEEGPGQKAAAALKEEREWEECDEQARRPAPPRPALPSAWRPADDAAARPQPSLVAPAPRHPAPRSPSPARIAQLQGAGQFDEDFDDSMDESSYDNEPFSSSPPPAGYEPAGGEAYGAWADRYQGVMGEAAQNVNVPNYRYPLYLVDQNIEEIISFLLELGIPDVDSARRLLRRFRLILAFDPVETRLVPVVEFLSAEVGLSRPRIGHVLQAYPWILLFNPRREMRPVNELLRAVGLTRRQIAELWLLKPQLPRLYEQGRLQALVAFLREECGLSAPAVGRLIAAYRTVLTLSVPRRLAPKARYLLDLLGSKAALARALHRFPGLLGLSEERKLRPAVELLGSLGLSGPHLASAIAKGPQIITYRPEKVEAFVEYAATLGIQRGEIGRMVRAMPNVLGLSVEAKVAPTVEFLRGEGLDGPQLASLLRAFAPVLGLRLDVLKQKLAILRDELGMGLDEIARNPALLGYSAQRIRQRRAFLEELEAKGHRRPALAAGLERRGRHSNPSPLALSPIQAVGLPDDRFAAILGVPEQRWWKFKERWDRREAARGKRRGRGAAEGDPAGPGPALRSTSPRPPEKADMVADPRPAEGEARVAQLLEMDRIRRERTPRRLAEYGAEEEDLSELVGGAVTTLAELRKAVLEAGDGEEEEGAPGGLRPAASPDSPYFQSREYFIRAQKSRACLTLLAALFGGDAAKAKAAAARAPAILDASRSEQLRPALALLASLGIPGPALSALVARFPAVLLYPLETQITIISFLHSTLGFSLSDIGKLAARVPRLLGADYVGIQRNLDLLRGSLGLSDAELRTLVTGNPSVLLLRGEVLAAKQRAVFDLKLPTETFLRHPWIYTSSSERLRDLVAFAAARGVPLDPAEYLTGDLAICGEEGCNRAEAPPAGRGRGRPRKEAEGASGAGAAGPRVLPLGVLRQNLEVVAGALGVPPAELKAHVASLRVERALERARVEAERAEAEGEYEEEYDEEDEPRGRALYLDPPGDAAARDAWYL
eukprot:tig00001304_g8109.t1